MIGGLNILHAPRDLGLAELVPERHSSDPVVERLSRALEAAEGSHDGFGNLYADAVRLAIVTRLLTLRSDPEPDLNEPARATAALPKWRWKRVVDYIDSHLDETITLADMAAVAGLSRMYFAAQFRAATGIRPHEFLLRRRIDRAKQMLIETEMTLVDVALSVGFQNQAHFTTVFRRFVGETPIAGVAAIARMSQRALPTAIPPLGATGLVDRIRGPFNWHLREGCHPAALLAQHSRHRWQHHCDGKMLLAGMLLAQRGFFSCP